MTTQIGDAHAVISKVASEYEGRKHQVSAIETKELRKLLKRARDCVSTSGGALPELEEPKEVVSAFLVCKTSPEINAAAWDRAVSLRRYWVRVRRRIDDLLEERALLDSGEFEEDIAYRLLETLIKRLSGTARHFECREGEKSLLACFQKEYCGVFSAYERCDTRFLEAAKRAILSKPLPTTVAKHLLANVIAFKHCVFSLLDA